MDFSTWGFGAASGLGAIGLGNTELNTDGSSRDCAVNVANGETPDIDGVVQCGTEANPVGFDGSVNDSWSDFSPKVSLSYAPNDNNQIYALYSEGFKAGGFQQDARSAANLALIVDAELAKNYELGWKGSYDNLVFAVTAFKQEQNDIQVGNLAVVGSSQVRLLFNAEGIENTGLELEATWAATDSLTLGGFVALYDPKYKDGSFINQVIQADGTPDGGELFEGEIPANSVDEAWTLWASYDWYLPGGSTLSLRGDYRYRSAVWGLDGANNRDGLNINGDAPMYQRPELDKYGLRLSWLSAEENLSLALWGRNLDDDPDYINFGPPFGYVYNLGQAGDDGAQVRARAVGSTGRKVMGATLNYYF
eukprot:g4275.t1